MTYLLLGFVTRILQGISVGLITGTGTAYLSTLMPKNSAQVAAYVSLTTSLGFSSGALFTNAVLLYSNSLVPFSYWVVFLLISGCIGLAIGAVLAVSNLLLALHYQSGIKQKA